MLPEDARQEFGAARSRIQHGVLLGAVLATIGLAIMLFGGSAVPDAALVGAVNLVIGAGILLAVLRGARDRGARMVLDRQGIWYRGWGVTLPWREIDRVYVTGARHQPYVSIRVKDSGRFLSMLPPGEARRLRANRLWKAPEIRIPYGDVAISHDDLLVAIQAGVDGHA